MIAFGAMTTLWPAAASAQDRPQEDPSCASLTGVRVPNVTISHASGFAGGDLGIDDETDPLRGLPPFCRASATVESATDSSVQVEVWLPEASAWNGRFLATGNGGGAGSISYATGLVEGVKRGFAVANTDLGTAPDINEAERFPIRWEDFGHRANFEMARVGKALVEAFYGREAHHSYFQGCSTGGQQSLTTAQRYPDEFDGYIVGAPANNRTRLHMMFVWNYNALTATPESNFPPEKRQLVTDAVVAACAGNDGGSPTDTFLTDPRACEFEASDIPVCETGTDRPDCLNPDQSAALEKIYGEAVNPRTGERIYTAMPFGSEASPLGIDYQQDIDRLPVEQFYQQRWIFGGDFEPKNFDFDRDVDTLDARLAGTLNANQTNLSSLADRGAKIMMYSGTYDGGVPFQDALDYYERVVSATGSLEATQDFFRYYIVPGMDHCAGGVGIGHFGQPYSSAMFSNRENDILMKLVNWVENNEKPERFVGTAFEEDDPSKPIVMERPVCAYPNFPAYQEGDAKLAESYACQPRERSNVEVSAPRYQH